MESRRDRAAGQRWARLVLVGLLWAGASGCSGDAPVAADAGPDRGLDAAAASGLARPASPDCPKKISGRGMVWLDDPEELGLVERPLHCLEGDGTLRGAFVSSVYGGDWSPARATDHRFAFPFDDDRLQEVEAYYVVTAMVGHFQPLLQRDGPLTAIEIELLPEERMAISRYRHAPRKIWLGLANIAPRVLSARILGHEYGHHLIFSHMGEPDPILNEGVADYLVADFTGEPQVLSLDRLDLPAAVIAELRGDAQRLLERSVANPWRYPEDLVTRGEQCAFLQRLSAQLPPDRQLVTPERLALCDGYDADQRAEIEPHLAGRIVAGALWDLRRQLGGATVGRLIFVALAAGTPFESLEAFGPGLLAAAALGSADHAAAIRDAFGGRGLPLE